VPYAQDIITVSLNNILCLLAGDSYAFVLYMQMKKQTVGAMLLFMV
jgi:hypothetical protein